MSLEPERTCPIQGSLSRDLGRFLPQQTEISSKLKINLQDLILPSKDMKNNSHQLLPPLSHKQNNILKAKKKKVGRMQSPKKNREA